MAQRGACVQGERPPAPTLSVGAGLLAKASGQLASGLNVPPRASPPPPPTWGAHKYCIQPNSPVGASLLAMTPAQPPVSRELTPARLRSSRKTGQCSLPGKNAGACYSGQQEQAPSPQGLVSSRISSPTPPTVGAGLLAKAAGQLASVLNVSPRATAHTSNPGCSQILHPTQLPCGSELARESGGSACISTECIPASNCPHIQHGVFTNTASNPTPLWGRACSRKRRVSLHQY